MEGNNPPARVKPAKFKVEPYETSFRASNKPAADVAIPAEKSEADHPTTSTQSEKKLVKGKKKFVVEPIETIRRSKKAGDTSPVLDHNEKRADCLSTTKPKYSNPLLIETSKWSHRRGQDSAELLLQNSPIYRGFGIPRRQSSTYPHYNTRQHSYALPNLEPIISKSDSEKSGSEVPSLSTSPSMSSRDPSFLDLQVVGRRRESCDDRFSGYLLSLAARAAERQLREQALVAYPNAGVSERAEHFALDRENGSRPGTAGSTTPFVHGADVDLLREDSLEKLRRERTMQSDYEDLPNFLPHEILSHFDKAPAAPATTSAHKQKPVIFEEPDPMIDIMRRAARAPWLGETLEFAVCHSPKRLSIDINRFDPEEFSQDSQEEPDKQSPPCGGLWMGLCKQSPKNRGLHSLQASPAKTTVQKIPVPVTDAELDAEFTDDFITEVYNYLALGYPSLALPFDEELSRETGVSLEELRRCDEELDTQGYVGLAESVLDKEAVVDKAPRWLALRMYVRSWGRRNRDKSLGTKISMLGGAVLHRRGSWRN